MGFNLFVLRGKTRHEMNYIAKTARPMFLIMVLMVTVLVLWPELATWPRGTARQAPGGMRLPARMPPNLGNQAALPRDAREFG